MVTSLNENNRACLDENFGYYLYRFIASSNPSAVSYLHPSLVSNVALSARCLTSLVVSDDLSNWRCVTVCSWHSTTFCAPANHVILCSTNANLSGLTPRTEMSTADHTSVSVPDTEEVESTPWPKSYWTFPDIPPQPSLRVSTKIYSKSVWFACPLLHIPILALTLDTTRFDTKQSHYYIAPAHNEGSITKTSTSSCPNCLGLFAHLIARPL
jgi:hypothetical protein